MMPVIDSWRTMFSALSSVKEGVAGEAEEHDERHQREDGGNVAQLVGQEALQVEALGCCRVCRRHCRLVSLECQAADSRSAFSMWPLENSRATMPLRITVTRSASVRMVSGSVESTRMATPLVAQGFDDADHVFLGTHVHAAGGLRQDQHARQMGEPLGERHLLLVAARERAQRNGRARRPDLQVLDVGLGDLLFFLRLHQQAVDAAEDGDGDVLVDRLLAEQHHAPVFRHEGNARGTRRGRGTEAHGLAAKLQLAAPQRHLAEQRARQFDLARAHEAIDPGDLAGAQFDREVPQVPAVAHPFDGEHDGLGVIALQLRILAHVHALGAAPDHVRDDEILGEVLRVLGDDLVAVAEHRHPVRNVQHVVEEVRDEDDGAAFGAQPPQHGEELLHFRRRKGRGGLVQNDDLRAREQHAREFDELLQAHGQRAHGGGGVDVEPQAGDQPFASRFMRPQSTVPIAVSGWLPRNTFSATVRSGTTRVPGAPCRWNC
jgi:hypothetical protein